MKKIKDKYADQVHAAPLFAQPTCRRTTKSARRRCSCWGRGEWRRARTSGGRHARRRDRFAVPPECGPDAAQIGSKLKTAVGAQGRSMPAELQLQPSDGECVLRCTQRLQLCPRCGCRPGGTEAGQAYREPQELQGRRQRGCRTTGALYKGDYQNRERLRPSLTSWKTTTTSRLAVGAHDGRPWCDRRA